MPTREQILAAAAPPSLLLDRLLADGARLSSVQAAPNAFGNTLGSSLAYNDWSGGNSQAGQQAADEPISVTQIDQQVQSEASQDVSASGEDEFTQLYGAEGVTAFNQAGFGPGQQVAMVNINVGAPNVGAPGDVELSAAAGSTSQTWQDANGQWHTGVSDAYGNSLSTVIPAPGAQAGPPVPLSITGTDVQSALQIQPINVGDLTASLPQINYAPSPPSIFVQALAPLVGLELQTQAAQQSFTQRTGIPSGFGLGPNEFSVAAAPYVNAVGSSFVRTLEDPNTPRSLALQLLTDGVGSGPRVGPDLASATTVVRTPSLSPGAIVYGPSTPPNVQLSESQGGGEGTPSEGAPGAGTSPRIPQPGDPDFVGPVLPKNLDALTSNPNAHAFSVHGGGVTDAELQVRARTGVKPNGQQGPIPPLSSAFYSNDLLISTDQAIREGGGLQNAIARQPGETVVRVTAQDVGDLGQSLGYGYQRLGPTGNATFNSTAYGPLNRTDNLTSAQGIYEFNPVSGQWETITVYPAPR